MDTQHLIASAQKGNLEAFNRLVIAYQDAVYNLAYRILGERDAAEDATQETFLRAWRNIKKYRGGSWRGWLFRIATNICYDQLRYRQRRPQVPLEPPDEADAPDSPAWLADRSPNASPEAQAEQADLRRAIEICLRKLAPDFRAVLTLVDLEEFSYAETAQILGVPKGTVKSRLARARARMQECLRSFPELLEELVRLNPRG